MVAWSVLAYIWHNVEALFKTGLLSPFTYGWQIWYLVYKYHGGLMTLKYLYHAFIIICGLAVIILCSACIQGTHVAQEVSDAELTKIAEETPEARLFLKTYSEAAPMVDRSARLAVDFRYDPDPKNLGEYIRLRVFIDPYVLRIEEDDIFLEHRTRGRATIIRRPNIVDELKKGLAINERSQSQN